MAVGGKDSWRGVVEHRRARAGEVGAYVLVGVLIVGILLIAIRLRARTRDERVTSTAAGAAVPPSPAAAVNAPQLIPPGGPTVPSLTKKPTPVATGFRGCPPEGDGGDRALNRLKNRVDTAAWLPASIEAVMALRWPHTVERRPRAGWRRADSVSVAVSEGTPIVVEGYLVGAKQEGPESPNCHGADAALRDWHMWLSANPGRDRRHAMVVETTPVVRAMHPRWSLRTIHALVRDSIPVRVSGWLMLDPEHPDQVGKSRGTIWEIHPIMKIEVKRGGRWKVL